jgi:predicted DNA-binding transcriptional regulator AlpA
MTEKRPNNEPSKRSKLLASTAPRRGLRREDAAIYIGISASKFDQLVADGRMPRPVKLDGCVIWDMRRLDSAFDDLTIEAEVNPWDSVVAA